MRGYEPGAAAEALRAHWGLGESVCTKVFSALRKEGITRRNAASDLLLPQGDLDAISFGLMVAGGKQRGKPGFLVAAACPIEWRHALSYDPLVGGFGGGGLERPTLRGLSHSPVGARISR